MVKYLYLISLIMTTTQFSQHILRNPIAFNHITKYAIFAQSYLTTISNIAESCDRGSLDDCVKLGLAYERGDGVRQNHTRAAQLFARACDAGGAEACYRLAVKYWKGEASSPNQSIAANLFKKSCSSGYLSACKNHLEIVARERPFERSAILADFYGQAPEGFIEVNNSPSIERSSVSYLFEHFNSNGIACSNLDMANPVKIFRSVRNPSLVISEIHLFVRYSTGRIDSYRVAVQIDSGSISCLYVGRDGMPRDACVKGTHIQRSELRKKFGLSRGTVGTLKSCIKTEVRREPGRYVTPIIGNDPNGAPIYGSGYVVGGGTYEANVYQCPSKDVSLQCLSGEENISFIQGHDVSTIFADIDSYDELIKVGDCIRTK